MRTNNMAVKKMTYRDASKRLKEIMAGIEENRYDIDELVPILKEAKELIAFCNDKLYKVESEISKILENKPGEEE